MLRRHFLAALPAACPAVGSAFASGLRAGAFHADATPPLGSPVAYAPARSIEDPLSARGVVLLPAGASAMVLCAVDWIGIGNGGQDAWREALAAAAGTRPDRVAVHTLHQHDAPRCDFTAEEILARHGLGGRLFSPEFARQVIARTAAAVRDAAARAVPVTHLGVGQAKVGKVASNRRILGEDGKVKIVRYSASRDPEAQAAPEGVIDPTLTSLSLWAQDLPVAVLTYYATHPQSYYGKGDVTAEFVGLARAQRERDLPGVPHIHFNGASGNVAAGKYNDGSPERRPILTDRLASGMKAAWEATAKKPLGTVEWRVQWVRLPVAPYLKEEGLLARMNDPAQKVSDRLYAAVDLSWLRRARSGPGIPVACLRLGNSYVLHMPGELFVEYQLAAKKLRPDDTVVMAAYGDYGPGYIGTAIAYEQGGYETSPRASNVTPAVESVLMNAIRALLGP